MSTNIGVFSIHKEYLDNDTNNKTNTIPESSYILLNELLGIECNGGSHQAGCLSQSGILWFPSVVGVIQINPEEIIIDEKPSKPIITDISVDNTSQDLSSAILLSKNMERIEFHFTAPTYHSTENIKFKYKLEPFDKDWVDAGTQRTTYYTNIPSGNYEFKVIASNGFALWSDEYANIELHKEARIYETLWFYIAIAAFILLIIYFFFKLRLQYLANQKEQLIKLVDDRAKELELSKETLLINEKRFKTLSQEFQSILNSMPDVIMVLDKDRKVTWINNVDSNKDIFGKIEENSMFCLKKTLHEESLCDTCTLKDAIDKNTMLTKEIISHNGNKFWEVLYMPLVDENRELVSIVVIVRDNTVKKRAEKEILKKEKIESVGLLAAGIAHDFNNLLTGILGNISMSKLLTAKYNNEKIDRSLQSAETSAVRAKDLTLQLLTFSKGGEPIKKLANLNDIIKDSASFVLNGSHNKLKTIIPEDIWAVEIDPGQIGIVIQKLVINAEQASEKPGTITISCQNTVINENNNTGLHIENGDYVKVSVKDEGIGIPEEIKTKIFDPYFTTKPKGNGLGLATCYSIIKKHQGDLKFNSEMNKAAEFYFFLPACKNITPDTE
jgi:signal transduction histidine kinase/PAS domain-containing protein